MKQIFYTFPAIVAVTLFRSADAGCSRIQDTLTCAGNFNLTEFLSRQNEPFRHLQIYNTSITSISRESGFTFKEPFLPDTILIQNAPKLSRIDPATLAPSRNTLEDFRAIDTGLPDYNDYQALLTLDLKNPFADFDKLNAVHIAPEESSCPADPSILFPCTCEFAKVSRSVTSGLYGTVSSSHGLFANMSRLTCSNDSLTGTSLRAVFRKYAASTSGFKHFDIVNIGGRNIRDFPQDVFAGVSITALWIDDVPNLSAIDAQAFEKSRSIQMMQIDKANFTAASHEQVNHVFRAVASLVNARNIRLYSCGIPFVPNSALVPKNGALMHNLRNLVISFDRREHPNGVRTVGGYAFSGAPNLMGIGLEKNFIQKFEPFAFGFNETRSGPLTVFIGGNPFNDTTGLAPNAFSGSSGPLQIRFEVDSFSASDPANNPAFDWMPEAVFRPFLEENALNSLTVDHFNVDIWCTASGRNAAWMFDQNGILKRRFQDGIRIMRVEGNTVISDPESIRCKAESSFHGLPNCLVFPSSRLVHCGGRAFDVQREFQKLGVAIPAPRNISKLIFSGTGIEELKPDSFGKFAFTQVDFAGSRNLRRIHPNAFGNPTSLSIQRFSAIGTSLKQYPNFASFPNLATVNLDDGFHLNSETFDYTAVENTVNRTLTVAFDNGTIEPSTFSKAKNTTFNLVVGENRDCNTVSCLYDCQPTKLKFKESVFRPFLAGNSKNSIQTKCYLECDCEIQWIYKDWKTIGNRFKIWDSDLVEGFFCLPPGESIKSNDSLLGINPNKFNRGGYFKEHCAA